MGKRVGLAGRLLRFLVIDIFAFVLAENLLLGFFRVPMVYDDIAGWGLGRAAMVAAAIIASAIGRRCPSGLPTERVERLFQPGPIVQATQCHCGHQDKDDEKYEYE